MMKKPDHRMQIMILLLMILSMLMTVWPGMAETLPDQTGSTDAPTVQGNSYQITLVAPGGWSNNQGAVVKASITDRNNIGWQKIEYRMNDGVWIDCEDAFNKNTAEIIVHENGTFTLRVTDPYDREFEESAQVNSIDLTAPSVSASIHDTVLHIDVQDDLSGIAGVQVNSMLFTTITANVLDIELDENMNRFENLAIRAFDYAGNFSEPMTLENPHYAQPVDPTIEPTAAITPTSKPTTGAAATNPPVANTPATDAPATVTPAASAEPSRNGLGSSLIYVSDDDWAEATSEPTIEPTVEPTAEPTAEPTTAPTPEPIIVTEYIPIGPGMPYQADGNSHTLDVLYSAATNKQFITIQSKNGNTFYLVIDYDKPIDEDAELYETYFLNLVDERDLLALMSEEEKEELPSPTPEIIYVTPDPTVVPTPTVTPLPVAPEPETKPEQQTAMLALVAIVALVAAGAFFLLKSKGKGAKGRSDNDFELVDEDADETEES